MLIQTSNYCPECDQMLYMLCHPKRGGDLKEIIAVDCDEEYPHAIADGVYLDKDGVLCVAQFEEDTKRPDYFCLFCRWKV